MYILLGSLLLPFAEEHSSFTPALATSIPADVGMLQSSVAGHVGQEGARLARREEQEAAGQPECERERGPSKLQHVKGVLPWDPPHRAPLPEDSSAPWQLHIPLHLAGMLAASEGRSAPCTHEICSTLACAWPVLW